MKTFIYITLELLVLYFLLGHILVRKLFSARRRLGLALKEYEHHFRKTVRVHDDLLTSSQKAAILSLAAEAHELRKSPHGVAELQVGITRIEERAGTAIPAHVRGRSWVAEYLEVMVVALGVAFAVRGLFLQPFKIPTGSMEPTLYGIHFVDLAAAEEVPGPLSRFIEFTSYSRRYVDLAVERSGYLESIRPGRSLPFFPVSIVNIGGVDYRLPGGMDTVGKCLPEKAREYLERLNLWMALRQQGRDVGAKPSPPFFQENEVLAKGYLVSGDHLFVNRVSLHFRSPRRGDITVFTTDDIRLPSGQKLSGRYYIKRLVGLPGDTLRIGVDNKLYVKRPGRSEFELVGSDVNPTFARIYSSENGYHGYTHPGRNPLSPAQYLCSPEETYVVPADHYFMLGDNSANSQDSRYWGSVPRANLIGSASLVWWPLSERWGVADAPPAL